MTSKKSTAVKLAKKTVVKPKKRDKATAVKSAKKTVVKLKKSDKGTAAKAAKKTVVKTKKSDKVKIIKVDDSIIIEEVKEITKAFMSSCFLWSCNDELGFKLFCKNVVGKSYNWKFDESNEALVIYRRDKVYFDEDFIEKFKVHLDEIKNYFYNLSDKYAEENVEECSRKGKPLKEGDLKQFKLFLNPIFKENRSTDPYIRKRWIGALGFYVQPGNNMDCSWETREGW